MTCAPGGLYVVPVKGVSPQQRPAGKPPVNASYREKYPTDSAAFEVYRPAASGQARAVAIRGDVAYAAFGDAGLHVVRIVRGGGFEKLGELPGGHRVTDCCFVGDRLLVAEGLDGFALYELDGPAKFREVARRQDAGTHGRVAFWCWAPQDGYVALSARDGAYSFFKTAEFSAPRGVSFKVHACLWSRYLPDRAIGGACPVLFPYTGVKWVDLGADGAVIRPVAGGGYCEPAPAVDQRNGVVRFGDRFLCTVKDGYVFLAPDGSSTQWRPLGTDGLRGAPCTDGRLVLLTERSARKASVWDFNDARNPKLLKAYRLSGNPDTGAFFDGRALIPAGHQGLLLEKP